LYAAVVSTAYEGSNAEDDHEKRQYFMMAAVAGAATLHIIFFHVFVKIK
jgi:hypothetical protein